MSIINVSVPLKKQFSLEERKKIHENFKKKCKDLIYCVVERDERISSSELGFLDSKIISIPYNSRFSSIYNAIRRKLRLEESKAIFVILTKNNVLPQISKTMDEIYNDNKDEDGFIYITYTLENVFGFS